MVEEENVETLIEKVLDYESKANKDEEKDSTKNKVSRKFVSWI